MIISDFKMDNKENFLFTPTYQPTWTYYLKQYVRVMDYLLGIANKKQYSINSQYMSFMFIFRHSLELLLKELQYKKNGYCEITHNIADIYNFVKDLLSLDFKEKIDVLNWDGDGSEFRYIEDKDGNSFFSGEEIIAYSSFVYFIQIYNNLFPEDIMKTSLTEDCKIKWELTFHTNECRSLGVVRTHYDTTLSMLVNGINDGYITLEDIYLPILFLVRHGVELALKGAILSIGDKISPKIQNKIKSEHSILTLHNVFSSKINEAVNKIPKEEKLYKESMEYIESVKHIEKMIEDLDIRSYSSRFPFDKDGKAVNFDIAMEGFLDLIRSYKASDAYLTWCVDVLSQEGYLELGDEEFMDL